MSALQWLCWPLIRRAPGHLVKRHHWHHRVGRHLHRAAGVAVSKPAAVAWICVATGGGWWAGGLPPFGGPGPEIWPPSNSGPLSAGIPQEVPESGGSHGLVGSPTGPIAYLPPELIANLPPGPLSAPPLSLPPGTEIVAPTSPPLIEIAGPPTIPPSALQPLQPVTPLPMLPPSAVPPPETESAGPSPQAIPQAVPEPSSLALLAAALGVLFVVRNIG
jgi:hypothetical protein